MINVKFGTTTAKSVTVKSATQVVVVSPVHAAGTVRVSVTTAKGTTPATTADLFKYVIPVPAVVSLSPASGPASGGAAITVNGTALSGATAVYFGTTKVTSTISVNSGGTQLTVKSPAGPSGSSVDVRVATPGGTSPVVVGDLFTYGPTITSISRTSGTSAGGTKITVSGSGFSTVTSVNFRDNGRQGVHHLFGHHDDRHLSGACCRSGPDLGDDGDRNHPGHQCRPLLLT